jgi:hypothetical protein
MRSKPILINLVASASRNLLITLSTSCTRTSPTTFEHFLQLINMGTDSNTISHNWVTVPLNGGSYDQPDPPAYAYTAAANHFATRNYNPQTSPVTTAASSRRSGYGIGTFPTPLPSVIEMQNLGAGASTSAPTTNTPSTNTRPTRASTVLPTPVTQPKKQHGAACRFTWMVLKIVGTGIAFAAVVGLFWCIYRLIYYIAYGV